MEAFHLTKTGGHQYTARGRQRGRQRWGDMQLLGYRRMVGDLYGSCKEKGEGYITLFFLSTILISKTYLH